jgi:adenylate cyclase class IV
MGYRNREIETKLEVIGTPSLDKVAKSVDRIFGYKCTKTIVDRKKDVYWKTPKESKADFVRLRHLEDGRAHVTVKFADKGSNENRVEIDLVVDDPQQAYALLAQVFGKPKGTIDKRYFVYFLEDEHTTVSVYRVMGDRTVYIEAEAKSLRRMGSIVRRLGKQLPWKLKKLNKSLYQIYLA